MPINNQLTDSVSEENKITPDVIDNLKEPRFVTACNPIIISRIHLYCKMLLDFSKNKHDSKEIAYLIDLVNISLKGVELGTSHNVSISSFSKIIKGIDSKYLIIHNHPSNLPFSPRDFSTFFSIHNIVILIVIGNRGSIYILEKTKPYNAKEKNELLMLSIKYKLNQISFDDVIMNIRKYGVIYIQID